MCVSKEVFHPEFIFSEKREKSFGLEKNAIGRSSFSFYFSDNL